MEDMNKEFLQNPDILIDYKAVQLDKALKMNSVRQEYCFVPPVIANCNRKHDLSPCWSAPLFL